MVGVRRGTPRRYKRAMRPRDQEQDLCKIRINEAVRRYRLRKMELPD